MFTPSNVTNPNLDGSNVIGQLRDQMQRSAINMFNNKATLYTAGLTVSKSASPGEKTVGFTRYGRPANALANKAVTGLPAEQSGAPQDTVLVPVSASEWQRAAMDNETVLDAALDIRQNHIDNTLRNMYEQWDKRFLRTLTLAANASAVSGISSAPSDVTIAPPQATIAAAFPVTAAGGDGFLTKVSELMLKMLDLDEGLDPSTFTLVIRPAIAAAVRQSNRFMSRDFSEGVSVPKAQIGTTIDGMPILSVHESLWPKTNITDDSGYNVNAAVGSSKGIPGAFIIAKDALAGPVAECIPPSRAGLEIRPYQDDETDTIYIQSRQRYSMRLFVPSRVGTVWVKA